MTTSIRHSHSLVTVLLLAACAAGPEDAAESQASPLFINGGFESGSLAGWTRSTFLNATGLAAVPPVTTAELRLSAGGVDFTSAISHAMPQSQLPTAGPLPVTNLMAGPGVPMWPRFGMTSVVINQYGNAGNPHQGANRNVNSIKQAMATSHADVDPSDGRVHVRFVLSPELEAAGHVPSQQPYFFAVLRNLTAPRAGDLYTNFNFANQPGVPWTSQGTGATALLFTDWQIFDIVPPADRFLIGDTLEVEIFAAGCQPSGHSGTAYVDGFGAQIPSLMISKIAPAFANIDTDITYTFLVQNHTSGIAPNVIADEVIPPNTTFVSVNAPGAVCSTPMVGGTGTVSCKYGWLNPNSGATFSVTVHNFPASTQGTATGGAAASITDGNQAWQVDAWRGYTVYIVGGQGAGQQRVIASNTSSQLSVVPAWVTQPNATSVYKVVNPPADLGTATGGSNTTLVDGMAGWSSNQWLGYRLTIVAGRGAGQQQTITGNTAQALTVPVAWGTNPNNTSIYVVDLPVTSVVNGNYGVTGMTVSRLLGPRRETRIGSGAVLTDLEITKTNGVPGVIWGGAPTYTIKVVNRGPSDVIGALVTDTFSPLLATHPWTCTPSAGAACGAMAGAGDINTTVNLKVGASVTFLVAATVIAGVGNGTLSNVATVTPPMGVVDTFPDNNSSTDQDGVSPTLRLLSVTKDLRGTGQGTVTSSPPAIDCGPGCGSQNASFAALPVVTLHAVAVPWSTFLGWSGDCMGSGPTCTLTMSADRNVSVLFTACGNGLLDPGEGCDDGDRVNGGGCDANCLIEDTRPCNAAMPGLMGGASCASGVCNVAGGAPGVCAPADVCGNGRLEFGEGCDDGNRVNGDRCNGMCKVEDTHPCNDAAPGLMGSASCASSWCNSLGGQPGVCAAASGCGNGLLEANEGCDDGNRINGDRCNGMCKVEDTHPCNDSAPGLMGSASCASSWCNALGGQPGVCAAAGGCGNGLLEANEGCDDGNLVNGDACNAACKVEDQKPCNAAAPGLMGSASCASGRCNTTGGLPGICAPGGACGNGALEANEGCDDGNLVNGDACNAACKVEDQKPCNAAAPGLMGSASCASGRCNTTGGLPGICAPGGACGNGALEANEGCDDGNLVNGDACNAACKVEDQKPCNAAAPGLMGSASCASGRCNTTGGLPGICAPGGACGNGALEANEGCDDGNLVNGDACNAACKVEDQKPCNAAAPGLMGSASCASGRCDTGGGPPGVCAPSAVCGNGTLEADEGCDDGNLVDGDGCSARCEVAAKEFLISGGGFTAGGCDLGGSRGASPGWPLASLGLLLGLAWRRRRWRA